MADYGIFRTSDAKRIAAATKRVEGSPRTYVHVPQRVPNRGGGASAGGQVNGDSAASWTIAEYDPATGAVIQTLDRGRNRTSADSGDAFMMFSSDGYLYAAGRGRVVNGIAANPISKWNINTGQRVWVSDSGVLNITEQTTLTSAVSVDQLLIEASDGAIWYTAGNIGGTSYVCRFDPDTGEQTHASSSALAGSSLFVADNAGSVGMAVRATSGVTIRVFDNTVTQTASYTGPLTSYAIHNGILYVVEQTVGTMFSLNADDLTSIDTRNDPVGELYEHVCTDGTSVFVAADAGTDRLHSYAASNFSTNNWSVNRDNGEARSMFFDDDGYIYIVGVGGTWKFDPADGSELWQSTTATAAVRPGLIGRGSDYIAVSTTGTSGNVVCINRSDGETRWRDHWATTPTGSVPGGGGCIVGPDDRLFVCGFRLTH